MVMLSNIDKMLIRMIKYSKGQFAAILVIIIVGISVFTSLNMTAVNMQHTVDTYYLENHFADLFIQTAPIPSQAVEKVTAMEGVRRAEGRISIDVRMVTGDLNERVNMRIITSKGTSDELNACTLLEGKYISDTGREAMIVEQFATARNIKPGDTIKIQRGGNQYSLEISGIVDNPEYIYLMENEQSLLPDEKAFGVCYVSETFGRQLGNLPGNYNEILVAYNDEAEEELLIDNIESKLSEYGVKSTIKRENQLSNVVISEELKNLSVMANSIPVLFLLVAGLILIMMLGRMVKKDKIKIGILKALGYSNLNVLLHYVKYALSAGILGGFIGSVLGMALAGAMTKMYLEFFNIPLLRINFYISYVVIAMLLAAGICGLSGVVGARGVMKIDPADAMRPDSPKMGKRIFIQRIPVLWKNLSFSNKMVAKNIFRNRKRSIFILTGVSLTLGMMLFTTSMSSVMDQIMIKHFTEFQKMDYNISFQTPVGENVINDFSGILDVSYIEGRIEYPFEVARGNKKETVNIIGLERNTEFYSFKDEKGNAVAVPAKGILLSENLARILDVKIGENVEIKSFMPGRDIVPITVRGIIKQALGINAYMDIDYMSGLLLEKNMITGVYLDTQDKQINEKLLYASNVSSIMSGEDSRAVYEEYMNMMFLSIGFMVIFSGILGFCIVYNATIVNLGARELEFSSLRVLGFTNKEIFLMIFKENNIIMVLGILLGIPVGKLFTLYSQQAFSNNMYTLDMSPTPGAILQASLYTVLFIFVAQLATYRKIKELDFLQALKVREN